MTTLEIVVLSVLLWVVHFVRGPEGDAIEAMLTAELEKVSQQTQGQPSSQHAAGTPPDVPAGLWSQQSSVPKE